MPSEPAGNATGSSGAGGPDRHVEHGQHAAQPGDGRLRLVDDLGELGDRFEEAVREEHEADERAGGQAAVGPLPHADADHRRHGEHREHLARREQERTDPRRPDLLARLAGGRRCGRPRRGGRRPRRHGSSARPTRPRRSRRASRRCVRGPAVRHDEPLLHGSQHDGQRKRDDERNAGEQRVVDEHHDRHDQHQRGVAHPRHAAPLEELGERLDVAGDPGDQTATTLLAVIGEAQARGCARSAAHAGRTAPARSARRDGPTPDGRRRRRPARRRARSRRVARRARGRPQSSPSAADDATVDRLLDQDRDDDPPAEPIAASRKVSHDPLRRTGRLAQAAADRGDRRLVRVEARGESDRHDAPARSASNASTMSR